MMEVPCSVHCDFASLTLQSRDDKNHLASLSRLGDDGHGHGIISIMTLPDATLLPAVQCRT
eukprot:3541138-Rhodomonas_salina.5